MPFPTTGILDDFNRADEGPPPSSSWGVKIFSAQSGLVVLSNTLTSESGIGSQVWSTQFGPDSEAYCEIVDISSSRVALFVRLKDLDTSFDGYAIEVNASNPDVSVFRYDNGTSTRLGQPIDVPVENGDWFGIAITGSTISTYRKPAGGSWELLEERTDSTYSDAGLIGVRLFSSIVVHVDNFGGGNAVVPIKGASLFRGRGFPVFDDEEVNRFEFWPAVGAGATEHERAVSVEATGTITTAGQRDLIRSTSIAASANISATGNFFSVSEAAASINASASIDISGVGFSTIERSASLTASPVIQISGTRVVDRSVSIDAVAGIDTNAQFLSVFESAIAIIATASITTTGHGVLERPVGISVSSDISVSAQSFSILNGNASIDSTATITVSHQRELLRSVALDTFAAITVRGDGAAEEIERGVSIGVTAGIAVSGHAIVERSVSLVSSASISVSAISFSTVERSLDFNAAGTIHVSGFSIRERSVQIASTSDIVVSGQFYSTLERSVSFESVAFIAVSGISFSFTEYERSIAISATGTITVLGYPAVIILHPTNVNLLNSGQLSAVITNGTNSVSINSGETEAILNG